MNTKAILIGGAMALFACAAQAGTLYSQPYDGSGNLYASQHDISGGIDPLAAAYDDFTLSSKSAVDEVDFTGGYFHGGQAPIAGFTLTFYSDNAGTVGNALATGFFASFNETPVSGDVYSYSVSFLPFDMDAGTYWLSLVPDIAYPPQWGWATSGVGTGNAEQSFESTTISPIGGTNFAFDVKGSVPEASTWALMLVGFGAAGAVFRRRRTAVAA